MNKNELREKLFERHFECKNGIPITEFMELSKPIIDGYAKLKDILVNNNTIDNYCDINQVKLINFNNNNYLFFEFSVGLSYLIIDIDSKKVLNEKEILSMFDEKFFLDEFKQLNTSLGEEWYEFYRFEDYDGNIKKIIDFYVQNRDIFNVESNIFNKLYVGNAWTWLSICLNKGQVQLSFQTEDQFLYECLFMNSDLTPCVMQDATEKIGKEKMIEYFERIKGIRIPNELISIELCDILYGKQKLKSLIKNK